MSTRNPVVSVIIPTYNRAEDLKRAIDSVLKQTFQDFEILIIDNHSSDATDEMISHINNATIFVHKINNRGIIAASRNLGIKAARGKYIAFLDSDDWWTVDKLNRSVEELDKGMDLVYHDLFLVKKLKEKKYFEKVGVRSLDKAVYDDLLRNGSAIPNSSVVVRTELLRKINGLSEDIRLIAAEDYECWLRLSLITDKFLCINETLGFYWQGLNNSSSAARSFKHVKRLEELYFEKYIKDQEIDIPSWILYHKARAAYLLDEFSVALPALKILSKKRLEFGIKLKVIYMLISTIRRSRMTKKLTK